MTSADNAAMPLPAHPRTLLRSMAVRAAINQLACVAIAAVLWSLDRATSSFAIALLYSLAVGNCCWLLIDGGRELAARALHGRGIGSGQWPSWPVMAPIIVGGTVLGYAAGVAAVNALLGRLSPLLGFSAPALLLSVIAAVVVSWTFWARERLLQQRLEAQAAQRLASEARLDLLRSQLEPHMLFNTLANLRVLIGLDAARAQAMLDHLIAFLRTTLSASRETWHPLAREFDVLADYLALIAVRMGPRLESRFELPDDLRAQAVPPLLLQPLVENAIRHGLEPRVEGGRVEVRAWRDGDALHLSVRDTGVGLSAAAAGAGGGFGLQQVRDRLATLYGDRAALVLGADARGGTCAEITLPTTP